jgi:hypothetical protein
MPARVTKTGLVMPARVTKTRLAWQGDGSLYTLSPARQGQKNPTGRGDGKDHF